MQADHRTGVVIELLRARLVATVAERQINNTFTVKHDAAAEMLAGTRFRLHAEQQLHLGHAVIICVTNQFSTRQCRAPAARAGGVIGPVDPAVLRVLRMYRHLEQATLASGDDLRQAFDRFRIEFEILANDAQPAFALGHQHAAVGQEGHGPRVLQAAHEGDDAEAVFFGLDGLRGGRRDQRHQDCHSDESRNPEFPQNLHNEAQWFPLSPTLSPLTGRGRFGSAPHATNDTQQGLESSYWIPAFTGMTNQGQHAYALRGKTNGARL